MIRTIVAALLGFVILLASGPSALAGPVEWVEVPATEAGQQWWDRGSIRDDRAGFRTVLSRFTPAPSEDDPEPCLLYTSPSPRDRQKSRMPSSA